MIFVVILLARLWQVELQKGALGLLPFSLTLRASWSLGGVHHCNHVLVNTGHEYDGDCGSDLMTDTWEYTFCLVCFDLSVLKSEGKRHERKHLIKSWLHELLPIQLLESNLEIAVKYFTTICYQLLLQVFATKPAHKFLLHQSTMLKDIAEELSCQ